MGAMVKCERNIFWAKMTDDLLVFAFFFVPFVNFSPVACGTIVLCSLISILCSVFRCEVVDWRKVNMVSIAVLTFMIVTTFSSLPVVEDMKQFTRLQFQLRLPMLLFPFAFLFRGFAKFDIRSALTSFALGTFATSLIVIIVFSHSLFTAFDNISRSFLNVQICFQCVVSMIIHRTYLCFNLITGLLIFYYLFSDRWNKWRMSVFTILLLYTAVFVYMTDARISLVVLLWVGFSIFVFEIKKKIEGWKFYASLFSLVALLFFVMMQSVRINNIIVNLFSSSFSYQDLDPRFRIWHCGWLLFEQSPHQFIGTGTGSLMHSLPETYRQDGFLQAIESKWEMHNQFLEVLVENGMLGLFFLLLMLILPLFLRSPYRSFYLIWIPSLCVNLFFESMLSRSLGTYPIMAILVLAGMVDNRERVTSNRKTKKYLFLALYFIALICLSAKFVMKDKKEVFSEFQRYFERVDDLPGDVPPELEGQYGLKIDSTVSSDVWRTYAVLYHRFDRLSLSETDSVHFSAYVYVSEDFNAEILSLRIEERESLVHEISYDFSQKGTWQKLDLSGKGMKGNTVFLISSAKENARNFEEVKGYAIFANPIVEIIK